MLEKNKCLLFNKKGEKKKFGENEKCHSPFKKYHEELKKKKKKKKIRCPFCVKTEFCSLY